MSILLAGAARLRGRGRVVSRTRTIPYQMPSAAPYNAPTYAWTPTPDHTGSMVHPSVVDMRQPWHGWRYWMAATGYYNESTSAENPSILVSNNGYHWQPPAGLTNPVYPFASPYNSDTDLTYDPDSDRMILVFRNAGYGVSVHVIAASPDGTTWPATPTPVNYNGVLDNDGVGVSPCLVRRGPDDWWLIGGRSFNYSRAADPFGVWTAPASVPAAPVGWHADVVWDGGAFRALHHYRAAEGGDAIRTATWTGDPTDPILVNDTPVITPRTGQWDAGGLYRPTLTMHENGADVRAWYCAKDAGVSWRIAHTIIPRAEWPNPSTAEPVEVAPVSTTRAETLPAETGLARAITDLVPEAYWKCNDTAGQLRDWSGYGHHGKLSGVDGVDYMRDGESLTLLTDTGMAAVSDHFADLSATGKPGLTVFAITRGTQTLDNRQLLRKGVLGGAYNKLSEWLLHCHTNGGVSGGYQQSSSARVAVANSGSVPGAAAWRPMVMVLPERAAGNYPTFYIGDTTPRQELPLTGTQPVGAMNFPLLIGGGFIGSVCHLAVLMRPLSVEQIGSLMAAAQADGYAPD